MQYNDAWRVHVRASNFVYSPIMGREKNLFDSHESGTSKWLFDRKGEVKKGVRMRTFTRGGYSAMYPKTMK